MSSKFPMKTMAHLPMDIINDLFHFLPATTLVRFRVLSKPCSSLIDSPDFVASHLRRNIETGDHLMILLRGPRFLRTVYLDSPEDKVSDVEHPLQSGGFTEVFGSVNGLIGLANSPVDMALFNPSTRQIHQLPVEPIDFPERLISREYVLYGLGYDSVNDDYKVVRMIQCKKVGDDLVVYEIKVFSLKSNSWSRVRLQFEMAMKFFYFYYHVLHRRQNGVQVENSLNWILPRGNGVAINTIIRFDLASEEFEFVFYPVDFFYENKMDLCVLDGCLCMVSYNESSSHVDVWIKREYEAEGSWSKLFSVTKPEGVESLDFVRPLMYSKDKSKVLLEINVGKLVWFDLASESFQTLGIKDCEGSCSAEIVLSSLVLGCKGDPRGAREDIMMQQSSNKDGFMSKGDMLKLLKGQINGKWS